LASSAALMVPARINSGISTINDDLSMTSIILRHNTPVKQFPCPPGDSNITSRCFTSMSSTPLPDYHLQDSTVNVRMLIPGSNPCGRGLADSLCLKI
jgi:hypothetical protein